MIREKMKMSFLLSTVFLLLLQSSFAAENPTHEGKDCLNHEFAVAQFSRVAQAVNEKRNFNAYLAKLSNLCVLYRIS